MHRHKLHVLWWKPDEDAVMCVISIVAEADVHTYWYMTPRVEMGLKVNFKKNKEKIKTIAR